MKDAAMTENITDKSGENPNLSERERAILRTIVSLYILNAMPVGSRYLSKYLTEGAVGLSPATLRNIMADLEEMDYISHPHTSAGRVPTDKGYRFFVDTIPDNELNCGELPISDTLPRELSAEDSATIFRRAGELLGTVSHYLAIVRIPQLRDLTVRKIDLMKLSSSKLLVVVALESNVVRTVTLEIPFEATENALQKVSQYINEKISGKTLNFIRKNFTSMVREESGVQKPLIGLFVSSIDKLFHLENSSGKLHVAGTQNLLNLPEFDDVTNVRKIFDALQNEDELINIIDSVTPGASGSRDFSVLIGSELRNELYSDYSLVISSYTYGSASGSIGLIGPRRMDYTRVISLVREMGKLLTK